MEGTVTGRGIKIKWTADNPKQASSGASECFQRNVMTKHRRNDRPMRKMIGKSRERAEKSGGGRGRKDNVGIGGRRLWQAYHRANTMEHRKRTVDEWTRSWGGASTP